MPVGLGNVGDQPQGWRVPPTRSSTGVAQWPPVYVPSRQNGSRVVSPEPVAGPPTGVLMGPDQGNPDSRGVHPSQQNGVKQGDQQDTGGGAAEVTEKKGATQRKNTALALEASKIARYAACIRMADKEKKAGAVDKILETSAITVRDNQLPLKRLSDLLAEDPASSEKGIAHQIKRIEAAKKQCNLVDENAVKLKLNELKDLEKAVKKELSKRPEFKPGGLDHLRLKPKSPEEPSMKTNKKQKANKPNANT